MACVILKFVDNNFPQKTGLKTKGHYYRTVYYQLFHSVVVFSIVFLTGNGFSNVKVHDNELSFFTYMFSILVAYLSLLFISVRKVHQIVRRMSRVY